MTYKPETVQFVFYLPTPEAWDALSVWNRVFPQSPSSFQRNPPGGPVGGRASDIWQGMNVTLVTQPGRVDVFFSGLEEEAEEFPYLKSADTAFNHVKDVAKKLMTSPGIRVALVTTISEKHKTIFEAVRAFAGVTGTKVPDKASDLVFALNLTKPVKSLSISLNRILRSEVQHRQKISMQGIVGAGTTQQLLASLDVLVLTIDVNSVPTGQEFQPPKLNRMLDEVISETRALISEGYGRVLANG
ncbi:hypothetical protein [Mesorhizobium sp.]|uniref:hypothetical protein n=1 Tax=Mesorhizobium sp. TaxID=1871066 RepID=UPI000FE5FFA9|nr:hypothetical protein [Mesorhizobium sp.]RWO81542.1 MAG: hypothetical protein EOQ96_24770 [Mesorhizobium sp.]